TARGCGSAKDLARTRACGSGRRARACHRATPSYRDLLRPVRPPVLAQAALDDLVEVDDVVAVLVEELADAPAIDRGVVGADDDGVAALDVVEAAAGRAVAHQEFAAVGDDQGRLHHQGEVGDDAVDVL